MQNPGSRDIESTTGATSPTSSTGIDTHKRHTLKLTCGLVAASLLTVVPAISTAQLPNGQTKSRVVDSVLKCTIIRQPDTQHSHMLIDNLSGDEIALSRFKSRVIELDDIALNMAEAFVEPVVVPAGQQKMVRIYLDPEVQAMATDTSSRKLQPGIHRLSEGTQVVTLEATVLDTVGEFTSTARAIAA